MMKIYISSIHKTHNKTGVIFFMPLTINDFDNAEIDLSTISDVVNSPPGIVVSRLGQNIKTLTKALQDLGFSSVIIWQPTTEYSDLTALYVNAGNTYVLIEPHTSGATFDATKFQIYIPGTALGTSAVLDVQTSVTDITANRLLKVGAYGHGELFVSTQTDMNAGDYVIPGIILLSAVSTGLTNAPPDFATAGRYSVSMHGTSSLYGYQIAVGQNTGTMWYRQWSSGGITSGVWSEIPTLDGLGTSAVLDVQTSVIDTTADRVLKVGGYGYGELFVSTQTDMNVGDYVIPGIILLSAVSTGLTNAPPDFATAGRYSVSMYGTSTLYGYQIAVSQTTGTMWYRQWGFGGITAGIWKKIPIYEETNFSLGGLFTSGTFNASLCENTVTLTAASLFTTSASISDVTLTPAESNLPSSMYPSRDVDNIFYLSGTGMMRLRILTTGGILFHFYDYSGTPVNTTNWQSPNISYNV
jgi:hypothetical protein